MTDTVTLPRAVYQSLKAGAITGNAGNLLGVLKLNATSGLPRVVHPGDSFGRIVAWMWAQDREETMLLLADFLAELRDHHALSGDVTPPVSLAEVLTGLRLAWPPTAADAELADLTDYARTKVASYYGKPV